MDGPGGEAGVCRHTPVERFELKLNVYIKKISYLLEKFKDGSATKADHVAYDRLASTVKLVFLTGYYMNLMVASEKLSRTGCTNQNAL